MTMRTMAYTGTGTWFHTLAAKSPALASSRNPTPASRLFLLKLGLREQLVVVLLSNESEAFRGWQLYGNFQGMFRGSTANGDEGEGEGECEGRLRVSSAAPSISSRLC